MVKLFSGHPPCEGTGRAKQGSRNETEETKTGGHGVRSPSSAEDNRQLRQGGLCGRRKMTDVPVEPAAQGRMESAFQESRFFDACGGENVLTSGCLSGSLPVSNLKKGGDALAPMYPCPDCSDGTLLLIARTNCPVIMQNPEALNLTQCYHFCTFLNLCVATLRRVVTYNRNAWSLSPKYADNGWQRHLGN